VINNGTAFIGTFYANGDSDGRTTIKDQFTVTK
jgi:hypothetical protein